MNQLPTSQTTFHSKSALYSQSLSTQDEPFFSIDCQKVLDKSQPQISPQEADVNKSLGKNSQSSPGDEVGMKQNRHENSEQDILSSHRLEELTTKALLDSNARFSVVQNAKLFQETNCQNAAEPSKSKKKAALPKAPTFVRQLMRLNPSEDTFNFLVHQNKRNRPKRQLRSRQSTRIKNKFDERCSMAAENSEEERQIAMALELSTNSTEKAAESLKLKLDSLQDTYCYHATQEDLKNPILLVEHLYREKKAHHWGTIKIIPPASFKPPCMLDFDISMPIPTRKQKLEELTQGKAFKQNNKGYNFVDYLKKAKIFANNSDYKRFEDVEPESKETGEERKATQAKVKQTLEEILKTQFQYWKKVDLKQGQNIEVEYAADLPSKSYGSGFPRKYHTNSKFQKQMPSDWLEQCGTNQDEFQTYLKHPVNLNFINNQEGSLLRFFQTHLQEGISGITSPWTYFGMKYATFCWHTEDLMMYSINFLHHGHAKIWYCVPEWHANKLEKLMKQELQGLKKNEPNFIHHMTTMMSPTFLKENGIEVYRLIQHPGEFVITFPRSYHSGFSTGFNIGEAVNFGSLSWLDFGINAFNIYRKTREIIPIFSLEWLIYENLLSYRAKDSKKKKKSDQPLSNESLTFLDNLLDKPLKNFRSRGDTDEFEDIYEPQRVSQRQEMKGEVDSDQERKIADTVDYARLSAQVNYTSKERVMNEAVKLITKELALRVEVRNNLQSKQVEWIETKMHDSTGYDKYECSFCTDLPYFSALVYYNNTMVQNEDEVEQKGKEFKQRDRMRGIKKTVADLSTQKMYNACLEHELLIERIMKKEIKVEYKIRLTDQELLQSLEYARAQLQTLQKY